MPVSTPRPRPGRPARCPFCLTAIGPACRSRRCERCRATHHPRCWDESGSACAVCRCPRSLAIPWGRRPGLLLAGLAALTAAPLAVALLWLGPEWSRHRPPDPAPPPAVVRELEARLTACEAGLRQETERCRLLSLELEAARSGAERALARASALERRAHDLTLAVAATRSRAESRLVQTIATVLEQKEEVRLLRQQAQGGDPDAMLELGERLIAGRGVAQDPVAGEAWISESLYLGGSSGSGAPPSARSLAGRGEGALTR